MRSDQKEKALVLLKQIESSLTREQLSPYHQLKYLINDAILSLIVSSPEEGRNILKKLYDQMTEIIKENELEMLPEESRMLEKLMDF